MPQAAQFDPLVEYRRLYDDPRSDPEVLQKLQDPENFRKAFPDFDYSAPDADARISQFMGEYGKITVIPEVKSTGEDQVLGPVLSADKPSFAQRTERWIERFTEEHRPGTDIAGISDPEIQAKQKQLAAMFAGPIVGIPRITSGTARLITGEQTTGQEKYPRAAALSQIVRGGFESLGFLPFASPAAIPTIMGYSAGGTAVTAGLEKAGAPPEVAGLGTDVAMLAAMGRSTLNARAEIAHARKAVLQRDVLLSTLPGQGATELVIPPQTPVVPRVPLPEPPSTAAAPRVTRIETPSERPVAEPVSSVPRGVPSKARLRELMGDDPNAPRMSRQDALRVIARERNVVLKARKQTAAAAPQIAEPDAPGVELHRRIGRIISDPANVDRRIQDFKDELQTVRQAAPEVREKLVRDLETRADAAERQVVEIQRVVSAQDFNKEITAIRHENVAAQAVAGERVGVDPKTGRIIAEPLLDEITGEPLPPSRQPKFVSVIGPERRQLLGLIAGEEQAKWRLVRDPETGKALRQPKMSEEEKAEVLKFVEARRDDLNSWLQEVWAQGGRPTETQLAHGEKLVSVLQAATGRRFLYTGKKAFDVDPSGVVTYPGVDPNQAYWNRILGRPATSHFAKPDLAMVQHRLNQLGIEADVARKAAAAIRGERRVSAEVIPEERRRGKGIAAARIIDEPPKTTPEQIAASRAYEIRKLRGIIESREATAEEKAIAESQIQTHLELSKAAEAPKVARTPAGFNFPELARSAGLEYKGELSPGSNTYLFRRLGTSGPTIAVEGAEIPDIGAVAFLRQRMAERAQTFLEKPAPTVAAKVYDSEGRLIEEHQVVPSPEAPPQPRMPLTEQQRLELQKQAITGQALTPGGKRVRPQVKQEPEFKPKPPSRVVSIESPSERVGLKAPEKRPFENASDELIELLEARFEEIPAKLREVAAELHDKTPRDARDFIAQALLDRFEKIGTEVAVTRYVKALATFAKLRAAKDPLALRKAMDVAQTGGIVPRPGGPEAGFINLDFWRSPQGRAAYRRIAPLFTRGFVKLSDWVQGPYQEPAVNPRMRVITEKQLRSLQGRARPGFLERIAQLPGDVYYGLFDRLVFLSDKPGRIGNLLMTLDPRGEFFRDIHTRLGQKLTTDERPYVTAWLVAGGGGGYIEAHMIPYRDIIKTAQKAGLETQLKELLNLQGYRRTYEVLRERQVGYQREFEAAQAKFAEARTETQRVDARRDVEAARNNIRNLEDRMASGEVLPLDYTEDRVRAELINLEVTLGPERFAELKALADRKYALSRWALDFAHEHQVISDEAHSLYAARGPEYTPMHRLMEDIAEKEFRFGGSTPMYLRKQNIVHALRGSERINVDPVYASAMAEAEIIRESLRNHVILDYLTLAERDPQGVGTYFREVPSDYRAMAGETLVGAYRNGVSVTYATPDWLGTSLRGTDPFALRTGLGLAAGFGKAVLQRGATAANLGFAARNAVRDLSEMAALSDAGVKVKTLPKDAAQLLVMWNKALVDALREGSAWQDYMRSGAAYSGIQRNITPEMFLPLNEIGIKPGLGGNILKGRVLESVAQFNAAIEDATKMVAFQRLRAMGYSEKAAAYETRNFGGSPDFARMGAWTPPINLIWMFFNANVQGVTRVFRRMEENPKRVFGVLGSLTAMALALNEWNWQQRDDQGRPLMNKVPKTDRNSYFVVLTGNTYTAASGATMPYSVRIPKPHFAQLIYNPIENVIDTVFERSTKDGAQLALNAISNLLPGQFDLQKGKVFKGLGYGALSSTNPIIRVPVEQAANISGPEGIPIIPQRETGVEARYQYGPYTTPTARVMGEGGLKGAAIGAAAGTAMGLQLGDWPGAAVGAAAGGAAGAMGISPRRIQHVITTATAGVGAVGTGAVDPFLEGTTRPVREYSGGEYVRRMPLIGGVVGGFVGGSSDAEVRLLEGTLYDYADKTKPVLETYNMLMKRNPLEALQYAQENRREFLFASEINRMARDIGQISSQQRIFEQDVNMPEKTRQAALRGGHRYKLETLRAFTRMLQAFQLQ